MFQFTTTNVINSTQDLSTGLPLWCAKEGQLNIKRIGNFLKENVTHIYKAPSVQPVKAKAMISLNDLAKGDRARLNIYITLTQGSNYSLYATDNYFKGKPLVIDFTAKENAEKTAAYVETIIKKHLLAMQGDKLAKITADGENLVIDAVNEYQRFTVLNLEKLIPDANRGMGDFEVLVGMGEEAETKLTEVKDPNSVVANTFCKGREGFGTYDYVLHNLRMPTTMRTVPFAINQEENPVPGATYTQYTIHYCVNRGTLGNNAVGDQVTSHTTHVFYVNEALLNKAPIGELPEDSEFEKVDFESGLNMIAPDEGVVVFPPVE